MLSNIRRKFKLIIKDFLIHLSIITILFVGISTAGYYVLSTTALPKQNDTLAINLIEDIKNNNMTKEFYYSPEKRIEVTFNNKDIILVGENNKLIQSNKRLFPEAGFLCYRISEFTKLSFPYYVEYEKDNIIVKISVDILNSIIIISSISILILLFSFATIYQFLLQKRMEKFNNLKTSAQEYALSERTTSYLVSIMHHKLNTPLKILATKSRVLAQTIFESELSDETISKAEKDYINIDNALKTIFEITDKLRTFKSSSQSEMNIYKIFGIAIETIEILRDDEFNIHVDRKTKLFEIDKTKLSPHEMIQAFINQIKFSIEEMSTEINIKLFYSDNKKIKILFTDNGNELEPEVIKMIKKKKTLESLDPKDRDVYYADLLLNLSILEDAGGSLKIISSNGNGTTYEIVIPTFKIELPSKKKGK